MFRPSEKVAGQIVLAQQKAQETGAGDPVPRALRAVLRAEEMQEKDILGLSSPAAIRRPDANSKYAPPLGSPVNLEQVRNTIGEELDRLLGTLSRRKGVAEPGTELTVMTDTQHLEPAVRDELAERLGLDVGDEQTLEALRQLGAELYQWMSANTEDQELLGVRLVGTRLILTCRAPRPALAPFAPRKDQRVRPVPLGARTRFAGSDRAVAICCLVVKDYKLCLLTTNLPCAEGEGKVGTLLLQPESGEAGTSGDTIGTLESWVPINFTEPNSTAGALARTTFDLVSAEVVALGPVEGMAEGIRPGDRVQMPGPGGERIQGQVTELSGEANVAVGDRTATFRGLIAVQTDPFPASAVDSGAPVLTSAGELVGMAYAASETALHVVPFQNIVAELGITRLVTTSDSLSVSR